MINFCAYSYSYADQKEEDSQWDGGGVGEYYYSPGSSSDTQQLKTTYPVQQEVEEETEEVVKSIKNIIGNCKLLCFAHLLKKQLDIGLYLLTWCLLSVFEVEKKMNKV